jgi:hypothetical protein
MATMRRWWPLLAVTGLLAVVALSASGGSLPLNYQPLDALVEVTSRPTGPTVVLPSRVVAQPEQDAGLPQWLTLVLGLVCLVLVVAAVIVLLTGVARSGPGFRRRAVRAPARRAPPRVAEEEVVAALEAGLLDLDDADVDPRTAVIACWVRLEQSAAAAGVPRLPGDTSTDLVVRVLGQHSLSAGLLTGLADLYRRARYATHHEVDVDMRDQARSALRRLRSELTGEQVPA